MFRRRVFLDLLPQAGAGGTGDCAPAAPPPAPDDLHGISLIAAPVRRRLLPRVVPLTAIDGLQQQRSEIAPGDEVLQSHFADGDGQGARSPLPDGEDLAI